MANKQRTVRKLGAPVEAGVPPEVERRWMEVGQAWAEANGGRIADAATLFELACLAVWLVTEQREQRKRDGTDG
jgi:hypothetical protein